MTTSARRDPTPHPPPFLLTDITANAKCTDCEEVGHFNKNYYKCKFYKGAAADDASYGPSLQHFELTLHDFTLPEVAKDYHPIFVDPGRKSVFTAVSDLNEPRYPIIRCSTKEYYHLTASTVSFYPAAIFEKSKRNQEFPQPRHQTRSIFLDYVQYLFDNINTLFNFYNSSTAKKMLPTLSREAKSTRNYEKLNKWRPIKYKEDKTKVPLIVFGSGMFNKEHQQDQDAQMWGHKREAAGQLITITIDEFRTSKVCSKCQTLTLMPASPVTGLSVLARSSCHTLLCQRDINASRNMMTISISIWQGRERPTPFQRTTTTTTPPQSSL
ncbi:uncharacterized protein BX663DRAFT_489551 [Cokeromyces recurvatus]|uniref:uncharacterized protein n=1 Tax=Cokeromyces recurvatus TaxID=90255 RepID=UPI00221F802C|nr:uncharacterized protein BX663DRAFT_489551 [Cokeromyces recurvatus]KAI7898983.1 hypothetical protein BX663DRAFT_489551 [Cokeromyces recurvatus]